MSGLLLIWAEPGAKVSEEEYNDFSNSGHAEARLALPGFLTALQYKATDDQTPSWLALYDLIFTEAAMTDEYKALAANASDSEKALISRFQTLNRRIYKLIYQQSAPSSESTVAKYILVVCIDVLDPSDEDDINKWYNEDHIPDISKTHGWIRSRRYKLQSSIELSSNKDVTPHAHQYLAFHEFNYDQYFSDPAFIAAGSTPERKRYGEKTKLDFRTVALHRQF